MPARRSSLHLSQSDRSRLASELGGARALIVGISSVASAQCYARAG